MSDPSSDAKDSSAAARVLFMLNAQIHAARTELGQLQLELANTRAVLDDSHASRLLEANERLVHSAMHARDLADSALGELSELAEVSGHDPLTGLVTRALFLDRLETAFARARRYVQSLAVLFIDLDGFKQVNDMHGHAAGDAVLKTAARKLAASVRECDTVSRFGGDEFVVLLTDVSSKEAVALVARKMLSALAGADQGDGSTVSASIGIALHPGSSNSASELIAQADAAMYRAKRDVHGSYAFHESGLSNETG